MYCCHGTSVETMDPREKRPTPFLPCMNCTQLHHKKAHNRHPLRNTGLYNSTHNYTQSSTICTFCSHWPLPVKSMGRRHSEWSFRSPSDTISHLLHITNLRGSFPMETRSEAGVTVMEDPKTIMRSLFLACSVALFKMLSSRKSQKLTMVSFKSPQQPLEKQIMRLLQKPMNNFQEG